MKKKITKIDLTPTWVSIAPIHIQALIEKGDEAEGAKKEIMRMAEFTDKYNELSKAYNELHNKFMRSMPKPRKEPIEIKIVDFTKDKDEPAYDVECYIDGKFDNTYDGVFSTKPFGSTNAYQRAIKHAISKLQQILVSL